MKKTARKKAQQKNNTQKILKASMDIVGGFMETKDDLYGMGTGLKSKTYFRIWNGLQLFQFGCMSWAALACREELQRELFKMSEGRLLKNYARFVPVVSAEGAV
jgi:hypothetical protein